MTKQTSCNRMQADCLGVCDWLCLADVAFVVATSAAIMAVVRSKNYSVEQLGLALTYCFLVPMFASWIGQLINMLLMMFTSLERLIEYKSVGSAAGCLARTHFGLQTAPEHYGPSQNAIPRHVGSTLQVVVLKACAAWDCICVHTGVRILFRYHRKRLGSRTRIHCCLQAGRLVVRLCLKKLSCDIGQIWRQQSDL